ncbi:hypothetical protein [Streptomyces ortus]|uniref:Uncharacterized protein n=1 Tax=Streptomyces ortus TaxID=2867268 RepID=A0ABT3V0F8_9ACTN|nr:hypothetical protein [Streptomyces ortus]MCX4231778.1 hypothetical protein [Streptomyces ortus]
MTGLSGIDLARQALVAARKAAKKNGATTKKPKRRTGTVVRRDGREPLGLGAAIGKMMTERGMVAPAAGGSVLAQFDTILARRFWIRRRCSVCDAKAGQNCTDPGEPGGRRYDGDDHDPGIRPLLPERDVCLRHRSYELAAGAASSLRETQKRPASNTA